MTFPKQIQDLIDSFERLPGIGPKTAARLAFYLLSVPDPELLKFSRSIADLRSGITLCRVCKNISEGELCAIDNDKNRDSSTICVVETPLDVFSLERTGKYNGVYHVLHGVINPLNNIGPDELYIDDLSKRVTERAGQVAEVILALNPTMEGEATAMYISKQLKMKDSKLKITRLGVGMPIGGDMQYADETTLSKALEGRREF